MKFALVILSFLISFAAAAGQTPDNLLKPYALGTVKSIPRSDQIMLDNGKTFTLANIRIPAQYSILAQTHLEKSLIGKKVGLYVEQSGTLHDRYGNISAHAMAEDGTWVQGDMVEKGFAWAFSTPETPTMTQALYALENKARAAHAGFWRDPAFAVQTRATILKNMNSFQVYEGRIESSGSIKSKGINFFRFSSNPREDLSILVKNQDMRVMKGQLDTAGNIFNPDALVGKSLRIRGWIEDSDGPVVYLTHPAQIEFVTAPVK